MFSLFSKDRASHFDIMSFKMSPGGALGAELRAFKGNKMSCSCTIKPPFRG